jgi:hypothetical protein
MVVHALGGRIETDPGRKEGNLALQVHGGQDYEGWFKNVEILVPVK